MTDDPGQPQVLVSDRQTLPVDEAGLIDLARTTLLGEGLGAVELSSAGVPAGYPPDAATFRRSTPARTSRR